MTTKFTPGPWYVGSGTYEGRNIYSVASVTDDEGFTYQPIVATAEDDGIDCWDANARLIAAAPELLEALKWYESKAKQMGRAAIAQDSKLMLELMKEIAVEYGARARAAIARATGEQS
jgi:hypothetical protein